MTNTILFYFLILIALIIFSSILVLFSKGLDFKNKWNYLEIKYYIKFFGYLGWVLSLATFLGYLIDNILKKTLNIDGLGWLIRQIPTINENIDTLLSTILYLLPMIYISIYISNRLKQYILTDLQNLEKEDDIENLNLFEWLTSKSSAFYILGFFAFTIAYFAFKK